MDLVCFSPDSEIIIMSREDTELNFMTSSGKKIKKYNLKKMGFEYGISKSCFSDDSKYYIALIDFDNIIVFDRDGKIIKRLKKSENMINDLQYCSGSGNFIISSLNKIKVINPDGKTIHEFQSQTECDKVIISPQENIIATTHGWNDSEIRLWTVEGRLLKVLEGHSDKIKNIIFSQDGLRIISYSYDSTIKIWDVKSGQCINTIVPMVNQSGNFAGITYTPDYYYRLSGDAVNAVAFVKKMKAYGFDQFDLRHNRPDIVLERLYPDEKDRTPEIKAEIARYKKYWEYRVAKNGFTTDQVSGTTKIHAPEILDIKLNGTALDKADTTVKDKSISLSFKIRDEKDSNLNVIGYKLFVNGVPLYGQYIKRFDKPAKEQSVSDKITLSTVADVGTNPGDNKIEISGFTEDGVESSRETLYIRYDGADLNKKGNLYIVSFGVNDYSNSTGFESLTYAAGDAQDIVNTFKLSGKEKYGEIITMLYTDNEVNRDTIKAVRERLAKTNVNDTVIFFMSGHGVRADTGVNTAADIAKYFDIGYTIGDITDNKNMVNVYYYMTGESSGYKPWEKGIPMDAIRYALDGIPARQKLLLIDTCQSGEKPELAGYTPSADRLAEIRSKGAMLAGGEKDKGIKLVHRGIADKRGIEISSALALDMKEMSDMFPELRRGTGTIEISAATGVQSALESSKWKNGAFTYVVKEGVIDGKAKDANGKITAKSLRSYVLTRVEELTEGDQTPMVCRDIAGRDFEVGK